MALWFLYLIKFGFVVKKQREKHAAFKKVHVPICLLVSLILQGKSVNDKNFFTENIKFALVRN